MKRYLTGLILFVVLMGTPGRVQAQEPEYTPYQQALKDFLEASGTLSSMEPIIHQLMEMMLQVYPSLSWEVLEMYEQEMKGEFVENVVVVFEEVYKKRLTQEDLQEITAFYRSPVGRKWAAAVPEMNVEAMQLGQNLGMKIAQRISERLAGDGLIEL